MQATSDLLVIRPSLQLLGTYESGLFLPSVDVYGRQAGGGGNFGATAIASLSGYHRWKHTIIGLDYQGHFRHYTRNKYQDGIDQNLSLNLQRQTSARTTFSLTGVGGTFSRAYGLGGVGGYALNYGDFSQGQDPTLALVPGVDALDTRTYYAAGGADVVYQKNSRLSIHAGGSAFAVRRRVRGLVELDGYTGRSDVMYRVSRNSTLGIDYSFNNFRFVRGFGASDVHIAALNYSVRLDRNWTLSMRGGAYRMENQRLARVQIDPAVAAILGQSSGIEAFYNLSHGSIFGAGLTRNFRNAGFTLRYDRGISPGNSMFLTSRSDTGIASYTYRGFRRWSIYFNVSGSRMVTTFQDYGEYKALTGGAGTTYRVTRYLHLIGNGGWRSYELQGTAGRRNSYFASVGLGFAPGDLPLSLR